MPEPGELAGHLRDLLLAAAARHVPEAHLRVGVPRVRVLRQTAPTLEELTPRQVVDDRTTQHATGASATETRHFQLCVDVPALPVGTELLAARVTVLVRERSAAREPHPSGIRRLLGVSSSAHRRPRCSGGRPVRGVKS